MAPEVCCTFFYVTLPQIGCGGRSLTNKRGKPMAWDARLGPGATCTLRAANWATRWISATTSQRARYLSTSYLEAVVSRDKAMRGTYKGDAEARQPKGERINRVRHAQRSRPSRPNLCKRGRANRTSALGWSTGCKVGKPQCHNA